MKRQHARHAPDDEFRQCPACPHQHLLAAVTVYDQLGHHRIELAGHHRTTVHPAVQPDARPGRGHEPFDAPRHRQKAPPHILGIDAKLHRMPDGCRRFRHGQGQSIGHPQLLHHQVDAGGNFRHRMLHLQPRVHLQKGDGAIAAHQKLHRTRAHISRRHTDILCRLMNARTLLHRQKRRRSLFHQLLVAPLQRAVACAQHHHMTMCVGHHLCLHMARPVQILLDKAFTPSKGRGGLAHGRRILPGHLIHLPGHLQPAPAAAKGGLDGNGQTMLARKGQHLIGTAHRIRRSGHQRSADGRGDFPGGHLVAQLCNGVGLRPDPHQAGIDHRLRKRGIFREKAIARVHRIRPAAMCDVQQFSDVQIGFCRALALQRMCLIGQPHVQCILIHVGIHRHALHAMIGTGTNDAHRNFAAVGNQDFLDHFPCSTKGATTRKRTKVPAGSCAARSR